jgi:hypothetical protein
MGACRFACDHDLFRRHTPFAAARPQKANRRFDVVNLSGKPRLGGQTVVNTGNGKTFRHKRLERHFRL